MLGRERLMNSQKTVTSSVRCLPKSLVGKRMPSTKRWRFILLNFTRRFIRFTTFTRSTTFMISTIKKSTLSLRSLLVQTEASCSFAKLRFLLRLVQIREARKSPLCCPVTSRGTTTRFTVSLANNQSKP